MFSSKSLIIGGMALGGLGITCLTFFIQARNNRNQTRGHIPNETSHIQPIPTNATRSNNSPRPPKCGGFFNFDSLIIPSRHRPDETRIRRWYNEYLETYIRTWIFNPLMSIASFVDRAHGRANFYLDYFCLRLPVEKKAAIDETLDLNEFEKCCICLAEIRNNEIIRELQCGHRFHKNCIDKWMENEKTCPLDRQVPGDIRANSKLLKLVLQDVNYLIVFIVLSAWLCWKYR